jgi:acetylornithine deacetylase/succinyl-diaminopimelate desuccinylase-like protein
VITRTICALGLALLSGLVAPETPRAADALLDLLAQADIRSSLDAIKADEGRLERDQIRLCQIPAPPFHEAARAQAMRSAFEQAGLSNVRLDRAGNVLGDRPGVARKPHIVVAAHLDTVFPEGTDVRVMSTGTRLKGPGIGDNCRGLAVMLSIVRALARGRVQLRGSITFVADVGEEGLGDLRGVRELFGVTLKGQVDQFIAIDGAGLFLTTGSVGSHRYRVTFAGPGGHSYAAFGAPNPIQAMGRVITKISQLQVPGQPKTTFSVGRVGGGTSINAIPSECWMEVDLRSTSAAELAALTAKFDEAVDAGVRDENARWSSAERVTVRKDLVGDRPAGRTPDSSVIVQTARRVSRALGLSLAENESSTDANIPMMLGIPAVTIGAGGVGAGQHTAGETFDTAGAWQGTQYALLLTIALGR